MHSPTGSVLRSVPATMQMTATRPALCKQQERRKMEQENNFVDQENLIAHNLKPTVKLGPKCDSTGMIDRY